MASHEGKVLSFSRSAQRLVYFGPLATISQHRGPPVHTALNGRLCFSKKIGARMLFKRDIFFLFWYDKSMSKKHRHIHRNAKGPCPGATSAGGPEEEAGFWLHQKGRSDLEPPGPAAGQKRNAKGPCPGSEAYKQSIHPFIGGKID